MKVMEKAGAGKHPAPLGCAAVDADSVPSKAPGRSRWLTAVVLAVVAGFFVVTLAARWNDVISLKWRLDPCLFAAATVLLALSYGLVAWLWGLALGRYAGTRPSAGARIWFLSNLARYVPGNVWSYVGAVELARREGVARRVTLAVMALTQVLSVGVAVAAGLPVLLAERARLGRPALLARSWSRPWPGWPCCSGAGCWSWPAGACPGSTRASSPPRPARWPGWWPATPSTGRSPAWPSPPWWPPSIPWPPATSRWSWPPTPPPTPPGSWPCSPRPASGSARACWWSPWPRSCRPARPWSWPWSRGSG